MDINFINTIEEKIGYCIHNKLHGRAFYYYMNIYDYKINYSENFSEGSIKDTFNACLHEIMCFLGINNNKLAQCIFVDVFSSKFIEDKEYLIKIAQNDLYNYNTQKLKKILGIHITIVNCIVDEEDSDSFFSYLNNIKKIYVHRYGEDSYIYAKLLAHIMLECLQLHNKGIYIQYFLKYSDLLNKYLENEFLYDIKYEAAVELNKDYRSIECTYKLLQEANIHFDNINKTLDNDVYLRQAVIFYILSECAYKLEHINDMGHYAQKGETLCIEKGFKDHFVRTKLLNYVAIYHFKQDTYSSIKCYIESNRIFKINNMELTNENILHQCNLIIMLLYVGDIIKARRIFEYLDLLTERNPDFLTSDNRSRIFSLSVLTKSRTRLDFDSVRGFKKAYRNYNTLSQKEKNITLINLLMASNENSYQNDEKIKFLAELKDINIKNEDYYRYLMLEVQESIKNKQYVEAEKKVSEILFFYEDSAYPANTDYIYTFIAYIKTLLLQKKFKEVDNEIKKIDKLIYILIQSSIEYFDLEDLNNHISYIYSFINLVISLYECFKKSNYQSGAISFDYISNLIINYKSLNSLILNIQCKQAMMDKTLDELRKELIFQRNLLCALEMKKYFVNFIDDSYRLEVDEDYNKLVYSYALKNLEYQGYQNEKSHFDFPSVYLNDIRIPPNSIVIEFYSCESISIDKINDNDYIRDNLYYAFAIKKNKDSNSNDITTIPPIDGAEVWAAIQWLQEVDNDNESNLKLQYVKEDDIGLHFYRNRLFSLLIKPIYHLLKGCDTIYISADGVIGNIPFAILGESIEDFLIDKYNIIYLDSLRDLKADFAIINMHKAMAIGHPQQSIRDSEQHQKDIKYSEYEVRLVSQVTGGQYKCGLDANKKLFAEKLDYSIVHISTHGLVQDNERLEDPETSPEQASSEMFKSMKFPLILSRIFLSGSDEWISSGIDDEVYGMGILTAEELRLLDLSNVQLVLMSSCWVGSEIKFLIEKACGMRWAIKQAKAKSSITSLWPSHDAASVFFIYKFYQCLKIMTISESLRETQLFMRKLTFAKIRKDKDLSEIFEKTGLLSGKDNDKPFSNPIYWGGFVYQMN
ncbi:MAG: CHAT domain-containing protein [Ruminiclostridium sp.]